MSGRVAGKVVALAREGVDVVGVDVAGPVAGTLEAVPATPDELAETGRRVEAAARGLVLVQKTPLGVPWIAPEDVAPAVAFLAPDESREARVVSGTTVAVTGGDSAHFQ